MEDRELEEGISTPWRIIRDTAILSTVGSLFVFIKPLRGIALGRILGPYDYGLLSIPLPYIQLFSIFANMGLSAALLRMVALKLGENNRAGARAIYRLGISCVIMSSVAWSAILSFLGPFLARNFADEPNAVGLIILGAWMIPATTLFVVFGNLFLAFERGSLLGAVRSGYSLLGIVVPVGLVLAFRQPYHVLLGFVAVEYAGVLIALYHWRKKVSRGLPARGGSGGEHLFPLLKLAHSFFYANLGWILINSVDRIMIQRYCATEILGFYAVAVFFANFLNIIPMNFSQVITPTLTKALSRNEKDRAWEMVGKTTRAVSFFLAPIIVFISAFSLEVVSTLFSDAFSPAATFLKILAFLALLNYLCKLSWSIIVSDANPGVRSLAYLAAALINIGLNLLLIPRYGGVGAAWASIISFAILALILQALLHKKIEKFLPLSRMLPPFAAAAVSFPIRELLASFPTGERLAIGLGLSSLCYLALTTLLGIVRKGDVRAALSKTSRLPGPMKDLLSAVGQLFERLSRE